jgi:hypothetical protein
MLAATAKLMSGDASAAVTALTAQATAAQSASITSLEVSCNYMSAHLARTLHARQIST